MLDQIKSQAETLRKQDIRDHRAALYEFVWASIKETLRERPRISYATFIVVNKVRDSLYYFVEQGLWSAIVEEYISNGIILDFNATRQTLKISWS